MNVVQKNTVSLSIGVTISNNYIKCNRVGKQEADLIQKFS